MAMMDGNNRRDDQPDPADWWSQQPQPTTATGSESVYDAVAQLYRTALGREGTAAEIHQWADGKTPADLAGIQQAIYNSDEAKAYGARQSATTAVQKPEPVTPNPAGTITGNTGAVPFGVPTSGFGAAPPTYVSDPNAPVYQPLPAYTPPTWTGGDYQNPTEADLVAMPGYQTGLDAGVLARNRSAAAQGTVLNGGTLKALDRFGTDYAQTQYQTLRNNTYDAYVQKYKQFTDAAGMDLAARTQNANENQQTFADRTSTYLNGNARTLSDYLTNATATRNSELDYWNRLQDLNTTGAGLAGGSR